MRHYTKGKHHYPFNHYREHIAYNLNSQVLIVGNVKPHLVFMCALNAWYFKKIPGRNIFIVLIVIFVGMQHHSKIRNYNLTNYSCRIGAAKDFKHCHECKNCFSTLYPHKCLEGSAADNCQLCLEVNKNINNM